MPAILETYSLCKNFNGVTAADNINIKIEKGEIVGIIGANGAGKTTFVNMITGYIKPSNGKIIYSGENITGLSPKEITKKGINRSFQIPQLFEELTVLDNILLTQLVKEKKKISPLNKFRDKNKEEKAITILKQFKLENYANNIVMKLPQGIRKLVDIAMAVIGSPEILLLDEPTSGVAIEEKFPLMDIVMEGVRKTGAAILFVEHDMEIVEKYSSRVIAFYEGRIIADGRSNEVLNNYNVKKYVIGFDLSNKEKNINA